jgi:hypothetical protein
MRPPRACPRGRPSTSAWSTVTGGWVIEDYYHFRGKKYTESTTTLGQFPVDAGGRLDVRFEVPEDYGGVHEVIARIDGAPVAQGGINLTQTFELTPASGPVGTADRVEGDGTRMAHHGKYLGRQLGQPRSRLGVGGGDARLGGGPASRLRSRRRSHRQGSTQAGRDRAI